MGEEAKERCGGDGVVKEEKQKERIENNEDNNTDEIIVIKVDMHCHCEACAKKIVRALRASQGVEEVAVDRNTNMVEVKGKNVEPPLKLCDRIRHKTGRQAHLLSPLPKPPQEQPTDDNNIHHHHQLPHKVHQQPPAVRTVVVLRVHMHCEACAHHLRKRIRKMKGVEAVETDVGKDEATVKGVIADPERLVEYVHKRTRKQVSLVKNEQIKPEDSASEQEKIEPGKQDQEQEKDDNVKNTTSAAAAAAAAGVNNSIIDEDDKVMMMMRMGDMNRHAASYNYWPSARSYDYMDNHQHHPINYQPQIFSDEDPNVCSIM